MKEINNQTLNELKKTPQERRDERENHVESAFIGTNGVG